MLREGGHLGAIEPVAQRGADARVGGVTGHEPERRGHAEGAAHALHLGAPQVQEAVPGHGVDQGLDDPAHARGHAAGEHEQRDAALAQRLTAQVVQALIGRRSPRRQATQVFDPRRAEAALHEVVRRALGGQAGGQPFEALGVEAVMRERRANVGGYSGQLIVERKSHRLYRLPPVVPAMIS